MILEIALVVAALGVGALLGRKATLSSVESDLTKIESYLSAEEKVVSAKIRALLGKL